MLEDHYARIRMLLQDLCARIRMFEDHCARIRMFMHPPSLTFMRCASKGDLVRENTGWLWAYVPFLGGCVVRSFAPCRLILERELPGQPPTTLFQGFLSALRAPLSIFVGTDRSDRAPDAGSDRQVVAVHEQVGRSHKQTGVVEWSVLCCPWPWP